MQCILKKCNMAELASKISTLLTRCDADSYMSLYTFVYIGRFDDYRQMCLQIQDHMKLFCEVIRLHVLHKWLRGNDNLDRDKFRKSVNAAYTAVFTCPYLTAMELQHSLFTSCKITTKNQVVQTALNLWDKVAAHCQTIMISPVFGNELAALVKMKIIPKQHSQIR